MYGKCSKIFGSDRTKVLLYEIFYAFSIPGVYMYDSSS